MRELPNCASSTLPRDATQGLVCVGTASLVLRLREVHKMTRRAWVRHARRSVAKPRPTLT